MKNELFLCEEISNGKEHEIELSYKEVLDAPFDRTIKKAGKTYKIIGKVGNQFGRNANAKMRKTRVTHRKSMASGVHASQVDEARIDAKRLNSGIEVGNDGNVSFSDRRARRDWNKHRGMHDRDGGYGD